MPEREPVYDRLEKVAAFEASLCRLEIDYIEAYFSHVSWDMPEETEAVIRAFEQLKRDGKARAVGVSTDSLPYASTSTGTAGTTCNRQPAGRRRLAVSGKVVVQVSTIA